MLKIFNEALYELSEKILTENLPQFVISNS